VTGLDAVRAEEVSSRLFFDELAHHVTHRCGEHQIVELALRGLFKHCTCSVVGRRHERRTRRLEKLREPVGDDVMLALALVSDHRL